MQPSTWLAGAFVGADLLAEPFDAPFRVEVQVALAVDRDHPVAGLEHAARPGSPERLPRRSGSASPALRRDDEEDREGEDDVDRRAGADHDDPLPDRLFVVAAVLFPRRQLVVGVHAADLHVAARGDRGDPVLGLAPFDRPDLRPEEEEEPLDPHPGRLGGEEVPRLVEDDQQREAEEDAEPVHACASPLDLLFGAAAGLGVDLEELLEVGQRRAGISSRTRSIASAIAAKPIRPSRKAATATSSAALSTQGAVPPPRRPRAPAAGRRTSPGRAPRRSARRPRRGRGGARRRRRAPGSGARRRSARACPAGRGGRARSRR